MRVFTVPLLKDNYAYIVVDQEANAVVIDPSEASPVLDAASALKVELRAIWLTHHHGDHTGGVEGICDALGALDVIGSSYDMKARRIPRQTRSVTEGARFAFGEHEVHVLEIPGHTLGAIAYHVRDHVFTGDTLFLGGCGRVFEGTMEMMWSSLLKLRSLPDATQVWCGHEYTVRNLEFALTVEPDNADVDKRLAATQRLRAADRPTVAGTIAEERTTNPFLRCDVPSVAHGRNRVETFTALRRAKDSF